MQLAHERVAYIGLALLHGRIAVRVWDFRPLTETRHNTAMDESQDGNCAQGDGDDSAVERSVFGVDKMSAGIAGLAHTRSSRERSR